MPVAYCLDVSGSISTEEVQKGLAWVGEKFKPGDVLVAFDIRALVIPEESWRNGHEWLKHFRGGTCARQCLELVESLGIKETVLISDGYMTLDQFERFGSFIDPHSIIAGVEQ